MDENRVVVGAGPGGFIRSVETSEEVGSEYRSKLGDISISVWDDLRLVNAKEDIEVLVVHGPTTSDAVTSAPSSRRRRVLMVCAESSVPVEA